MEPRSPLSEYFTSFQGEGPFTGAYCLFLRFSDCNFSCPFCDSRDRLGVEKHNLSIADIQRLLTEGNHRHLVITGGEPTLYIDQLLALYEALAESHPDLQVEVETNGAIPIDPWLGEWHFNISPKVVFADVYKDGLAKSSNCVYKFPLDESNYLDTVEFITRHKIPDELVWVMPMSESLEEYLENKDFVVEKALLHNWNFSTRLQVLHRFA